ncbi:MAG: excinuclease ABC subunit C [Parcubacteria bacterium C7867-003]|nr:MAG: excinuclease ABC subunit C [Parcubacteria bacterium C7867-003]
MIKSQHIKEQLAKLPDNPGVYFFLDKNKKILYIGKATSLKDRVRSYFNKDVINTRSPLISKMLSDFETIDFTKTDSVLEALILEAHLIKKHQPEANIKEKDNKSFNFVVITKEDFPRVLILRGRELLNNHFLNENKYDISYSFGPFPNGTQLKEALKIVRKMFPFRDKCEPQSGKPCFNRQIGLCPGVCSGEISKEGYAEQIENIKLFFEGNKKQLLKNLEKQMKGFAKEKKFEEANITKRTLFTLNHIQDVSLIKEDKLLADDSGANFRIESYDIAHMSGQNVVGVMTVVEDGEIKKGDYRKFKIKDDPGVNDTKALGEVLARRLGHIEWRFPDLIVVDGGVAQKNIIQKILKQNNVDIPVVSVVKDERHRPKEILGDKKWLKFEREILLSNAEAHRYGIAFHKQLRGKIR